MKIKSITIEGMHNVVKKTYEFSNLTYLHGKNGIGKSTVMQAIQLALLGYIPGTAKTKSELFRHANNHTMAVTLVLDSGVTIRRIWTGTSSNITATVEVTPEGYDIDSIISELELPIFNFDEFIGMTANKLKDWFINFLPSAETKVDWESVLTEDLANSGIVGVDSELVKDCAETIKGYGLSGVDEIRNANEYFKESLSFNEKECKRLQATIQSLVFYDDVDASISEEDVNNTIADYRHKQKHHNDMVAELEKYNLKKQRLEEYTDCKFDSAKDDERWIESHRIIVMGEDELSGLDAKLSSNRESRTSLQASVQEVHENIAELNTRNKTLNDIISSKGICPFTSESCNSIQPLIKKYEVEVDNNAKDIAMLQNKADDINSEISKIDNEISEIEYTVKKLNSNISDAKANMARIEERYRQVESIKSTIGMEPIVEDSEDYDALIQEQTDILVKICANKKYNGLIESITSDKYKIENEIAAYKSWIKLTGVNGLQNDDSATKPFLNLADQMDKYISTVFGSSVKSKFNLEAKANSFSFGIERSGSYVPFNLLSSGEKCLYTLALMISLVDASKSNLKIVMVDDLFDHLDNDNMKELFTQLQNVDNIQMIFAGVKDIDGDFVVEVS